MRWGILGAARINRSIIPALRAADGHTLEAIASRDADKAAAAAAEWEIPRSVAGYEALLADPGHRRRLHPAAEPPARRVGGPGGRGRQARALREAAGADPGRGRPDRRRGGGGPRPRRRGVHVPAPPADPRRPASWSRAGPSGRCGSSAAASASRSTGPATSASTRPRAAGRCWDVGCYPVSYARTIVGAEPEAVQATAVMGPTHVDMSVAARPAVPGQRHRPGRRQLRGAVPDRGRGGRLGRDIRVAAPVQAGRARDRPGRPRATRSSSTSSRRLPSMSRSSRTSAGPPAAPQPPVVTLADSRANTAALLAVLEAARTGHTVRPAS